MPSPKGKLPPQLRRGLLQRVKNAPPRPIVEQLPAIPVRLLKIPPPSDGKVYTMPNVSLRWPFLSALRLSHEAVEFRQVPLFRRGEGTTQTFGLKHINTGIGIRHAFLCNCGRAVEKLYYLHHYLACRRCHNAVNASQVLGKRTRPILQAIRIQSFLDSKPRLFRKTRERLQKKLGEKLLMAQGRLGTHARNPLE